MPKTFLGGVTASEHTEAETKPLWSEKERRLVDELMALQGLSEWALTRQAMRVYQTVVLAGEQGLTMGFYNAEGKRVEYPDLGSKLPPDGGN